MSPLAATFALQKGKGLKPSTLGTKHKRSICRILYQSLKHGTNYNNRIYFLGGYLAIFPRDGFIANSYGGLNVVEEELLKFM